MTAVWLVLAAGVEFTFGAGLVTYLQRRLSQRKAALPGAGEAGSTHFATVLPIYDRRRRLRRPPGVHRRRRFS